MFLVKKSIIIYPSFRWISEIYKKSAPIPTRARGISTNLLINGLEKSCHVLSTF